MPKIEVNKVAEILKRNELEPPVMRAIIEEMNSLVQPEVDDETPPPVKKQWCILISDPNGLIPDNEDFTGWVLQIPENESVLTTQERIHKAAYEFNTTKKGRMLPAERMGDAIENIPAKHFKEQQVWVKSKAPVLMLRTDNEIPMERKE
ncbi:hypothetical protein [Geminisphaera colitermitum]|uniref:hypothetical protein n=1 Tax=Geminisphaera colitermitum TaxID=1148786 RepID=UPI000158D834|nr:hypothetical protein [Geminisphaera colitermitum]